MREVPTKVHEHDESCGKGTIIRKTKFQSKIKTSVVLFTLDRFNTVPGKFINVIINPDDTLLLELYGKGHGTLRKIATERSIKGFIQSKAHKFLSVFFNL